MSAYYNENDPKAAAWLRELIKEGHVAPGDVDERSIEDIAPNELVEYKQCHFFAGLGGWSYALRLAGWPDDRAVWTGSCPCQPFSAAGKGRGFADERHLWPSWLWLARQRRPDVIFGEQVASAMEWIDLVQGDLEAEGYAVGYTVLGAHSVGAPHIRQRLYWVAHHQAGRLQQWSTQILNSEWKTQRNYANGRRALGQFCMYCGAGIGPWRRAGEGTCEQCFELGNPSEPRSRRDTREILGAQGSVERGLRSELDESEPSGPADIVGHAGGKRLEGRGVPGGGRSDERTPWTPSDLVWCRDGKWRPVEPGSFPLAHGVPERVGLLRGYGNAIVPQVAAAFIEATGLAR